VQPTVYISNAFIGKLIRRNAAVSQKKLAHYHGVVTTNVHVELFAMGFDRRKLDLLKHLRS